MDIDDLTKRLKAGERRALARAITLIDLPALRLAAEI